MKADAIIDHILEAEGGYVDDPDDSGGCTSFGITRATLSKWRGYEVDCREVKRLPKDEAREIYRQRYIEDPKFDELPAHLQSLMVDSGVQHGTERAIQWLQKAARVGQDGIIGPNTLAAINDANVAGLYKQVLAQRMVFYGEIISADHSQARFAEGWLRRLQPFVEGA